MTWANKILDLLSIWNFTCFMNYTFSCLSTSHHHHKLINYPLEHTCLSFPFAKTIFGILPGQHSEPLEWSARQKIAVGAARGLRYLHEECRVGCIVHRDMRPNNILVTHDFEPLVCCLWLLSTVLNFKTESTLLSLLLFIFAFLLIVCMIKQRVLSFMWTISCKVGDFGLARWQPDGDTGVETRVIGTFG